VGGATTVTVVGAGALAHALRSADALAAADVAVLVPPISAVAKRFVELADEEFAAVWEQPMQWAIAALQDAYRDGVSSVLLIIPAIALTGGREYAHVAAVSEGLRATVKSAARQWGAKGITVNTVVVPSEQFGVDADIAGPPSIAPPALGRTAIVEAIVAMATGVGRHVTGQTLVVDGGLVMP
jgi:NAD(P)-dependent dehydrogenase (short-subunit alcohol dehydrogenase family)